MSELLRHPALPFAVAAALAPLAGAAGRRLLALAAPAAALALLASLPADATAGLRLLGHEFVLLRADALARVFAFAFIAYGAVAGVYAWTEESAGARAASLALAGAGVGVVLAGDLLTLFLFWEWLTVASLFLVWHGGTRAAWGAGIRYALFHLLGATAMLAGILLRLAHGAPGFGALADGSVASWLILAGMLVNAAVPPLHAWLADAYPRASVYGTVFLAAFTTKAAVYALIRGYPGEGILVWGGTAMALFGVVYAVLENDIRRLLGYHIISQVGYMVAGVGLGTALALNGAAAHAFSHIFYKGLLLMSAGAVIHATGRRKLTELGALAGPLRWVLVLMLVGAASISGVPLFNGFVSKSMIVSAAGYADRGAIELLLLVASMGTFLHTGLKLPWFTFGGSDQGARVQHPVPRSMYVAMGLAAAVCLVTGIAPGGTLYALLPFDHPYRPFTAHHLVESSQLLVGTALGFWLLRGKLGGEATVTRDVDLLYRGPVAWLTAQASALLDRLGRRASRAGDRGIIGGWARLERYAQAHRNPTVALQTTVIVAALVCVAGAALLLGR
jgi:multicomponent Na+:H+ antiporter subunit D